MSENQPKEQAAARPTGKRQLAGTSTVSSDTYAAKHAEPAKKDDSEKIGGGLTAFFPEVVQEMRKVVWPSGREMLNYTLIVFGFLILSTALVWGVDTLSRLGVEAALIS